MIEELKGDFLQWLRGFYYVAKTGSVRKAAEIMNRNPSTISYQIRSLEDQLGVVLFDRYKKSLRITQEGRDLLGWTISTFETLQSMRSSVGNLCGELQGETHIAATLPMITMSACSISSFTRNHPRVQVIIDRRLSREVRRAVMESEVDFGLLPVYQEPEYDRFEPLLTARPLLIARRDNPWRIPEKPTLDDLAKLPYVTFGSDGFQDEAIFRQDPVLDDFCEHISRNSVLQINNYHLMMRFVWNMLGVAIIDELCFHASNYGADWEDLAAIPLHDILPSRLYGILVRKHKHLSPQARAFMDVIRSYFESLADGNDPDAWQRIRHRNL